MRLSRAENAATLFEKIVVTSIPYALWQVPNSTHSKKSTVLLDIESCAPVTDNNTEYLNARRPMINHAEVAATRPKDMESAVLKKCWQTNSACSRKTRIRLQVSGRER